MAGAILFYYYDYDYFVGQYHNENACSIAIYWIFQVGFGNSKRKPLELRIRREQRIIIATIITNLIKS